MNNLEATFLRSTEIEKTIGLYWYMDNHHYLKAMAEKYNVDFKLVCAITSVLSPSVSWNVNLKLTHTLLKNRGHFGGYKAGYGLNRIKARKIYRTRTVFPFLSGLKVVPFYYNLLQPLDDQYITIDSFMIACYYNLDKVTGAWFKPCHMIPIQDAIKKLANKYRYIPCQMQAIIWLAYHRIVRSMASYNSQLKLKIF